MIISSDISYFSCFRVLSRNRWSEEEQAADYCTNEQREGSARENAYYDYENNKGT